MSTHRQSRTWIKTAASVCATVVVLTTLVAGAIEARVRVTAVERSVDGVEFKLDEITKTLHEIRVDLERLDQRVIDFFQEGRR